MLAGFFWVLFGFVVVVSLLPNRDYLRVWSRLTFMVETHNPFRDLRWITIAQDVARRGGDLLVFCDACPDERPINYPRVWLLPRHLNIGEKDTLWLGWLAVFLFLGSACLFLIRTARPGRLESLYYMLFFLSPASLLAVERANNDIVVFTVLALGLALAGAGGGRRAWLYVSLALAAVLKIFPVVGFASLAAEKRRRRLIFGLVLFGLVLIYFFSIREDIILIILISRTVPRSFTRSYGGELILKSFQNKFDHFLVPIIYYAALAASIAAALAGAVRSARSSGPLDIGPKFAAFTVGASVYAATFFFGVHWDYRLIFLLFAAPFLFDLARSGAAPANKARLGLLMLASAPFATHVMALRPLLGERLYFRAELVVELLNWILAGWLLYFLAWGLLSAPGLAGLLRIERPARNTS